ncbi:hypothetical protein PRZ48_004514 [Zasmidium cellare]|uniref:F-box domain-containing protein n=1 Tax=Zasmidium cellare TaxID=395010 RepID=A0ABR0EPS2_ZASCE|nr:hypothetical protein PRZ48_004514 [Zasmidium cellare]
MAESPGNLEDQVCYLLDLPAELRNNIWEFACTDEEEKVDIASITGLPALTATCRQIRKETLALWMMSNSFTLCINGAAEVNQVVEFEQTCLKHIPTEKMDMKFTFGEDPTIDPLAPVIESMNRWAEHVHTEGSWVPDREVSNHRFSTMIITMLEIAMRCRGLPLDDVQHIMATSIWGITDAFGHSR